METKQRNNRNTRNDQRFARIARESEERTEALALLERAADVLNGQRLGYMREQEANAIVQEARALLERITEG